MIKEMKSKYTYMTTSFDNIELAIESALVRYAAKASEANFASDKDWTYFLKASLGDLGEENKYRVCTSGFKDVFDCEWLYDLVWYEELTEGNKKRLVDVPLVVECEWNPYLEPIRYDFEKLLIANASHKLMICYVHPKYRQDRLDYFKEAVTLYKHCKHGDRYMIAMLDMESHQFTFQLILK
jgi:hypothetical protein